jgi:hypothetical protein
MTEIYTTAVLVASPQRRTFHVIIGNVLLLALACCHVCKLLGQNSAPLSKGVALVCNLGALLHATATSDRWPARPSAATDSTSMTTRTPPA